MIHISDKTKEILEWIYCVVIALVLALLIRYLTVGNWYNYKTLFIDIAVATLFGKTRR